MSKDHDTEVLHKYVLSIFDDLGAKFPKKYLVQMKEVIAFKLTLNDETDRGCALMAASFIEFRIGELLKQYFVKDKVIEELFSATGPLGSFSSRIDIAYALSLIPLAMKRDLHILRKIRNEFAHEPQKLSFKTPTIANRCRELKYAGNDRNKLEPRECFTRAMLGIDGSIYVYILQTKKLSAIPDEDFESREKMLNLLNSMK